MTYPDPNDPDPTARYRTDVGEAPVTVSGDDGRDKLRNAECEEQGN